MATHWDYYANERVDFREGPLMVTTHIGMLLHFILHLCLFLKSFDQITVSKCSDKQSCATPIRTYSRAIGSKEGLHRIQILVFGTSVGTSTQYYNIAWTIGSRTMASFRRSRPMQRSSTRCHDCVSAIDQCSSNDNKLWKCIRYQ